MLGGRHDEAIAVDLFDETAGLRLDELSPFVAGQGIAECAGAFGPGEGYVEQAAFLLEVRPGLQGHGRREQFFFQAHDEDVFKLQALGGVDGHHADLVLVAVVLIGIGQQGNVQQEVTQ